MSSDAALADLLLVEDNEGDAVLIREALREAKIELNLHRVKDGVDALAYLRREGAYADATRPDLILLDLNMPRMDGREVLKEIKEDPELCTNPVVVLTTSKAEQDVNKSYELHANCFVTKPVDFDQLVKILKQLTQFWFSVACLPPK